MNNLKDSVSDFIIRFADFFSLNEHFPNTWKTWNLGLPALIKEFTDFLFPRKKNPLSPFSLAWKTSNLELHFPSFLLSEVRNQKGAKKNEAWNSKDYLTQRPSSGFTVFLSIDILHWEIKQATIKLRSNENLKKWRRNWEFPRVEQSNLTQTQFQGQVLKPSSACWALGNQRLYKTDGFAPPCVSFQWISFQRAFWRVVFDSFLPHLPRHSLIMLPCCRRGLHRKIQSKNHFLSEKLQSIPSRYLSINLNFVALYFDFIYFYLNFIYYIWLYSLFLYPISNDIIFLFPLSTPRWRVWWILFKK